MKNLIRCTALLLAWMLCLTGCAGKSAASAASDISASAAQQSEAKKGSLAAWKNASGSFARSDSSQYNNGVLQLKYLSDDSVLFEFRLMEGSESQESSTELVLPFVMSADENGAGHYESDPAAASPFSIDLVLSFDGKTVTVTHTGSLPISCDGVYEFTNSEMEVSEVSAAAVLEHLPKSTTGLDGAYSVAFSDSLIADWFYSVAAVADSDKAVLAKFLIAKDLSAVYRADDGCEPKLISGSAQPMLDAKAAQLIWDTDDEPLEFSDAAEELPLVSVGLENGAVMAVGASDNVTAALPCELPYKISVSSSESNIVKVEANGAVTTVAVGEANLEGTLTVYDAVLDFNIAVMVLDSAESDVINTQGGDANSQLPPLLYTSVLVADFSCGSSDAGDDQLREVPFEAVYKPDAPMLARELSQLTGLDFFVSFTEEDDSITADWAMDSTLIANLDDRTQKDDFHFFDSDSMRWFMMDSLYRTLLENLDVKNVYYTMNGGHQLSFEELYPVKNFPSDIPYMGSAFYHAHSDLKGDDITDKVYAAMQSRGESAAVVVNTGEETIEKEHCMVFACGDNSADGTKFTASYHYAVSDSGRVYYMDVLQGADWILFK